jgi:hypothetical protein
MSDVLTPSRLWKKMPQEQRVRAARAFWLDDESTNDQVQAVMLISQHKHFRPKTIVSLDIDRKAKHLASLPSVPDTIAARALIGYHLAEQRPMMGEFLDALGIPHEEGLIQDDATKPDPDKMKAAVESLTGKFPPEDVSLYLNTLVCQDPETWNGLTELMA